MNSECDGLLGTLHKIADSENIDIKHKVNSQARLSGLNTCGVSHKENFKQSASKNYFLDAAIPQLSYAVSSSKVEATPATNSYSSRVNRAYKTAVPVGITTSSREVLKAPCVWDLVSILLRYGAYRHLPAMGYGPRNHSWIRSLATHPCRWDFTIDILSNGLLNCCTTVLTMVALH